MPGGATTWTELFTIGAPCTTTAPDGAAVGELPLGAGVGRLHAMLVNDNAAATISAR